MVWQAKADAREAGRKEGSEETLKAALRGCNVYLRTPANVSAALQEYVELECARTHPPAEPDEDPRWTAGYGMGKQTGRNEGYEEGYNEGAKDKAAAVQAEHEKTKEDALAACQTWESDRPSGIGLVSFVATRIEEVRWHRTNPKPAKVTVSILKEVYDGSNAAWREHMGVTLIDPAEEKESKSPKPDAAELALLGHLFDGHKVTRAEIGNWEAATGLIKWKISQAEVGSCYRRGWVDKFMGLTSEGRSAYLANLPPDEKETT